MHPKASARQSLPVSSPSSQAQTQSSLMKRRQFLKSATVVGGSTLLLPKFKLFGADAPSNKLNLALIATGHRAKEHFAGVGRENVVAICDVHQHHLADAARLFPKAKQYEDWRKCLEQKDIDASLRIVLLLEKVLLRPRDAVD